MLENREELELRRLLSNPYDFFYEEENPEKELDNVEMIVNEVEYKKYLEEYFSEADREKEPWLRKALRHDPAFILGAENNYYKQTIPKELSSQLSGDELNEVIALDDPVTWGKRYLLQKHGGWKPRCSQNGIPYQTMMIRCRSKRIVTRAGRRTGKSAAIVVKALHKAFTFTPDKQPTYKIVIFTPHQTQIRLIFKMMELFIDGSPDLLSMVKDGKIPTRQQPNYELELTNGVMISGFVSGSSAIRGQAADFLIIDEASYLTNDDTDAVISLINEHPNVDVWVSSTPKGLKDWFYDRVYDKTYVSFYFPSDKFHPYWSKRIEADFRATYTIAGYEHEALALFSADGQGVFQLPFVEAALEDYYYGLQTFDPKWVYGLGVDWNDAQNGTQIKITGYNPETGRYRIVDSASVSVVGWTQTMAVRKVRELNRKWRPRFLYVDYGHGSTQIENLHEIGVKAAANSVDRNLINVKGMLFKSTIEVYDPYQRKKVKKELKPFMVNNAVRIVELQHIDISKYDVQLIKQMEGYIIDRYSDRGIPVYKGDPKWGDHELDALMLSLLGFVLEMSSLGKPQLVTDIGVGIGLQPRETSNDNSLDPYQKSRDAALLKDKQMEMMEKTRYKSVNPYSLQQSAYSRRGSTAPIRTNNFARGSGRTSRNSF